MLICLLIALAVSWLVYKKTHNLIYTTVAGVLSYTLIKCINPEKFEKFQSEWACAIPGNPGYPNWSKSGAFPFYYSYAQESNESPGDNTMTNMYRRLHNLDNINRIEIFRFGDALAGGGYGIPAEPYIGEAYDRAMMKVGEQIRTRISQTRLPYNELYDVPTRPLMGNFNDCELGNCQWNADADGKILGIPSQVGSQPAYY